MSKHLVTWLLSDLFILGGDSSNQGGFHEDHTAQVRTADLDNPRKVWVSTLPISVHTGT